MPLGIRCCSDREKEKLSAEKPAVPMDPSSTVGEQSLLDLVNRSAGHEACLAKLALALG